MNDQKNNSDTHSGSLSEHECPIVGLGDRIKAIRTESLRMSRDVMAEALGIGKTTLQRYENNEREPDTTFLYRLSKLAKVDLNWLICGDEGVSLHTKVNNEATKVCVDTHGRAVDLDEFVFIPRYNLRASAGHGAITDGEKPLFTMAFRKYWIDNFLRIDPRNLSVISVKGDSMEGVLNDRDVILLNHEDTAPGAGLYVLRIDGELIVKRVQRMPGGKLEISSANDAYKSFDVDLANLPDDFAVIGKVVWFGRML